MGALRAVSTALTALAVFGGFGHSGAHGLLTVRRLLRDYPFPALPRLDKLFGIVGRRVDVFRVAVIPFDHDRAALEEPAPVARLARVVG